MHYEGKEGKEAVVFWRLAEEAKTKMKRRREAGQSDQKGEIGQINKRTTGSRGKGKALGRKRTNNGECEIFFVESSERGLFLWMVASFYFRCD